MNSYRKKKKNDVIMENYIPASKIGNLPPNAQRHNYNNNLFVKSA